MKKPINHKNYKLEEIDKEFIEFLNLSNLTLHQLLLESRKKNRKLTSQELIDLSLVLEHFIAVFFGIEKEVKNYSEPFGKYKKIYDLKRSFLHRFVAQRVDQKSIILGKSDETLTSYPKSIGLEPLNLDKIDEFFINFLEVHQNYEEIDESIIKYAAYRLYFGPHTSFFSRPDKQDFDNLIKFERDGNLISKSLVQSVIENHKQYSANEAFYCIKCHKTDKDSCSKGFIKEKEYAKNPLGNILSGCPLDIKISEMIELYGQGNVISAFAIVLIDNPMIALTGKRICNDCSKACIYQRQVPVDVPSIESQLLSDVLDLPYGFEIYYLLTKWNPLDTNIISSKSSEPSIGKVLVVGSGPSGIALSYYLVREGCEVVMIDGMKIEPVSAEDIHRVYDKYADLKNLYNSISPQGFGGVCEFGITERWNKENLILARLILERNPNFKLIGGVKFGANITYNDTKSMGFGHIALCCGSSYPKIDSIDNIEAGNVRTASDFLMALSMKSKKAGSQEGVDFIIELPAYVLGAGLTGVDAASEIMKYYPILAKRIANKEVNLLSLNQKDREQLERFIHSAMLFEEEDRLAKTEGRIANYITIIKKLGGVYLCYRKNIQQSPSYRINHEELDLGLDLGFEILENSEITEIHKDQFGNMNSLTINTQGAIANKSARTLLLALGTTHQSGRDLVDSKNYTHRELGRWLGEQLPCSAAYPLVREETSSGSSTTPGPNSPGVYDDISVFGDMDKDYSGSVVKAIKSAKDGYQKIIDKLKAKNNQPSMLEHELLVSTVKTIVDYGDDIFEITIKAPLPALNFKPGQFFKLQNYSLSGTSCEPIPLSVYRSSGDLISFIVKKVGISTKAASLLKPEENVSLVGPLGKPFEQYKNSSVILFAEGIGAFSLVEYAILLKKLGNEVIFLWQNSEGIEINNEVNVIKTDILSYIKTIDLKYINHAHIAGNSAFTLNIIEQIKDKNPRASINTLMQCMMGGVCGRCFMKIEGKIEFMCRNHEHEIDPGLIENLKIRLSQNSLLEKLLYN